MDSAGSSDRLVQLFERDLRARDVEHPPVAEATKPKRRVSRELDQEVVAFVAQERTEGRTPEQMLVELKGLLARAAADVPASQRSALMASITGRAINLFFDSQKSQGRDG